MPFPNKGTLATREPPPPKPSDGHPKLRRFAESPLGRYGIALLSIALALFLQRALGSFIHPTPFLLFFGAVMLAGWWGGWGPGLLSTGLSAPLAWYYFLPPFESFQLSPSNAVSLCLFVLICTLMTRLNATLRKKNAERALLLERERVALAEAQTERARLHGLLMEAPAFVALFRGPEHVYVLSNPLNDSALGKQGLLGKPVREAVPEAEPQGFVALLDRVYKTGEPFAASAMPVKFPRPDGSMKEYFLNFIYQPTRDAHGAIDGVASFGFDVTAFVTARRQAESLAAELRRSEERYRAFVSKSTEGIYRVELVQPIPISLSEEEQLDLIFRHGVVGECNDAMARMYGLESAAALMGARMDQLLVREDPSNTEYLRAFIQNGYRIDDAESHEVDKDGSRKVFLNNLVGILEENHVVGGWGTQRDVTMQRQAEEELRRAEANARFLSEASAVLASSLDYEATLRNVAQLSVPALADWCMLDLAQPDGTFKRVEVTTAAAEDFELAQQMKRFGLMPKGTPPPPPIQALLEGKSNLIEQFSPEIIRASAHDEEHARTIQATGVLSFIAVPMSARSNTFGVLSFFTSRSGRRYTAAHLSFLEELARRAALSVENARLYREAQEAIRLRDEFLSIASHELKTPLTPLSLKLHMLSREVQKQPDSPFRRSVEDYITIGLRQVKKLSELMSDLLDVARISGGRLRLELEEVELSGLVREVASRHEPQATKLGTTLQLDVQEGVVGHWDRLRLEQVITNLVDNALKYGAGKPVHVHLHADAHHAHLRVKDEGIGIAPEYLSRIFERFERAVSERHYGGLGLGLYITRTIVEAMGGSIQVESALGQGALFTVVLPLKPADTAPGSAPE
jgi:PAS domain S-box-containing protein